MVGILIEITFNLWITFSNKVIFTRWILLLCKHGRIFPLLISLLLFLFIYVWVYIWVRYVFGCVGACSHVNEGVLQSPSICIVYIILAFGFKFYSTMILWDIGSYFYSFGLTVICFVTYNVAYFREGPVGCWEDMYSVSVEWIFCNYSFGAFDLCCSLFLMILWWFLVWVTYLKWEWRTCYYCVSIYLTICIH